MKWSTKENNDKLKVQLEPLRSYTEHFDSGMIHMALPMATKVRVLIHQTDKSNLLTSEHFLSGCCRRRSLCDRGVGV